MSKSTWRRRYISVYEIRARTKYKQDWKEKPDEMRKHLAKATLVASQNKRTRRDELISEFRSMMPSDGKFNSQQLDKGIAHVLRNLHRIDYRLTRNRIKAARMTLWRHKVISFDPESMTWMVSLA